MVTINLYQGKGMDIQLDFPTDWDELDHIEVVEICRLHLINLDNSALSKAEFFFFVLKHRAKVQKLSLPEEWESNINIEDVAQILYLLDFLYVENTLTKQPFPTLQVNGKTFIGPANDYENLLCGEFEATELLFYEFIETPAATSLAKLAAILFREKGVPYQHINSNKLVSYDFEAIAPDFLQLQPWVLYTVYTWYCGCRQQLPKKFPTVYEGSGEQSNNGQPDPLSFTKCIHAGAGAKNGTRNEIRFTLLLEFMFEMEQEAIKTNELNKIYEQHT